MFVQSLFIEMVYYIDKAKLSHKNHKLKKKNSCTEATQNSASTVTSTGVYNQMQSILCPTLIIKDWLISNRNHLKLALFSRKM